MEIKVKANDFVALYSQTLKRKVIGKVTDDSVLRTSLILLGRGYSAGHGLLAPRAPPR